MPTPSFPQVHHYPLDAPPPPTTWNRALWGALFFADFTFGLTTKPDSEGHVVKKSRFPGPVGRSYRAVYDRLAADLEEAMSGRDFEEPKPVPWVDPADWTRKDFDRWRAQANSPLILKGLLADSRAVKEWSREWLADRYGDARIRCLDIGRQQELEEKLLVGENVPLVDLSVREFLTEDRYERFYVNNYYGLFTEEEFEDDLGGTRLDELRGTRRVLEQWFVSRSSGTGSALHTANADNLFVNVKGIKEWHFVHPAYTAFMMPALSKFAVYAVSEVGEFGPDNYEDRYREHPHLRSIPKLICQLEEGDVLYNPPWWWHDVQNRTPFNIGCATRYVAHPAGLRNIPLFHLCQVVDAVKHPRKSQITTGILAKLRKSRRSAFIDSVFSGEGSGS